jgi:hypothetical protein
LVPSNGIFCIALVSGCCWLSVDGIEQPVLLRAGEFAALPHTRGFIIGSDPAVPSVDFRTAVLEFLNGGIITWQGGGACLLLSAFFTERYYIGP